MKATVDIPDELYRRVKAKSALEGRPVREVAVELFQGYVGRGGGNAGSTPRAERSAGALLVDGKPAPPWFGLARKYMGKAVDHDMGTERESIERGWVREVAESEAGLRKPRKR
jgi:hypothetical protein